MGLIGPSHSPLGSDSGISDDSSTGNGNNNLLGCQSPHSSDSDIVPSPSYSQPSPVQSDPALASGELHTESLEALTVQTDHSYSLLQSGGRDMDILQSVRAEKLDTDVFIDLGMCNPRTFEWSYVRTILISTHPKQHGSWFSTKFASRSDSLNMHICCCR